MKTEHLEFQITKEEIANRLSEALTGHQYVQEVDPDLVQSYYGELPKRASVLIPFLKKSRSWHLLFTKRTTTLPEHSGQVAFPGGRADADDSDEQDTALREAKEEIGLNPEDVIVLGKLHDFITVTNYLVTPIVGLIPWPYQFNISKIEVSKVFTIPLSWLSNRQNYNLKYRELPNLDLSIPVIYYNEYKGEVLWGASARITVYLIDLLLNKKAGYEPAL